MIKLTLTIDVDYNENDVSRRELAGLLRDIASRAAGDGLFTGETPAEVDEWSAQVMDRTEAPTLSHPDALAALTAIKRILVDEDGLWREGLSGADVIESLSIELDHAGYGGVEP